jgi:hypothetical protein
MIAPNCNRNNGPLSELDAILADPFAYRDLPQVVWAFDPD